MAQESSKPKRFQGPKGTRDFYPEDMLRRRFLEQAWRTASIRNGFDEIEGPTLESLDLYRVKSGDQIVSELFHLEDRGGRQLALRPEFTPTLARMYADRANALPKPTKWFAVPIHYRAERPQRGRLREFIQWNVDLIGDDSPAADAEVIATAVDALKELGLDASDMTVGLSDRDVVMGVLTTLGVASGQMDQTLALLDRQDRLAPEEFARAAADLKIDAGQLNEQLNQIQTRANDLLAVAESGGDIRAEAEWTDPAHSLHRPARLIAAIGEHGILKWCEFDFSIVRGLAYYTGIVFEIYDAAGKERAVAGGGRYDRLIETFGGPPTPAVGFGMGDVVVSLMLDELGRTPQGTALVEKLDIRPDAFFVSIGGEATDARIVPLMATLRSAGLVARRSYRATNKLDKLLREAAAAHARYAVILGDEVAQGRIVVRDLDTGSHCTVPMGELENVVRHGIKT